MGPVTTFLLIYVVIGNVVAMVTVLAAQHIMAVTMREHSIAYALATLLWPVVIFVNVAGAIVMMARRFR